MRRPRKDSLTESRRGVIGASMTLLGAGGVSSSALRLRTAISQPAFRPFEPPLFRVRPIMRQSTVEHPRGSVTQIVVLKLIANFILQPQHRQSLSDDRVQN